MLEIALYEFKDSRLLIQPRILATTEVLERSFLTVRGAAQQELQLFEDEIATSIDADLDEGSPRGSKAHLRDWWKPVMEMKFDDPEQEPPYWVATNNVVLSLPFPGIVLKSWSTRDGEETGVFLSQTRKGALDTISRYIRRDKVELTSSLPNQTQIYTGNTYISLKSESLQTDTERYDWIKTHLNLFVNVLRPKMKQWYREFSD